MKLAYIREKHTNSLKGILEFLLDKHQTNVVFNITTKVKYYHLSKPSSLSLQVTSV